MLFIGPYITYTSYAALAVNNLLYGKDVMQAI